MQADERTRTVVHREWSLPTPAHHTEVAKALAVAGRKRDSEPGHPTDLVFTHGDDEIVIGYTVEQGNSPARGDVAEVVDQIVRAERDEWRRKAEFFQATIGRMRHLAVEWSSSTGGMAHVWRNASLLLHEVLDGPCDEPRSTVGAPGEESAVCRPVDLGPPSAIPPDPTLASARGAAAERAAFEDLLASLWLYIGRYEVKQLTTEQKNLLADSVDAANARLAADDPAYGEPARVERWWQE